MTPILATADTVKPTGEIRIIKKGEPAPFNGVIYDESAHALLVAKTKGFQARLKLELDFLGKKLAIQCDREKTALKLDLDATKKQLELEIDARSQQKKFLLAELTSARKTPWYRHPLFVFSSGFLLSAVITGLSIWGLSSIQK